MKNSKRLLAKLLVLCMIFGLLPAAALAAPGASTRAADDYSIAADVTGNGTVTAVISSETKTLGTTAYTVAKDTEVQVTFTPDTGYKLSSATYTVDGDTNASSITVAEAGGTASIKVTGKVVIKAVFVDATETTEYVVTMLKGEVPENGTVSVSAPGLTLGAFTANSQFNVPAGTALTVNFTANTGYTLAESGYYTLGADTTAAPIKHEVNKTTETVTVNSNVYFYASFVYAGGNGGSSSGGSGTSSTQQTVSAPSSSGGNTVVTVEVKPVSSGSTSIANITSANMQKAVDSAISTAAKNGTDPVVRVVISTPANATGIRLTLPATALVNLGKVSGASLEISSGVVEMTLDSTAVAAMGQQASGTVTISATPVANASLNAAQKAAVKDAKVVDLSIVSNGKTISTFNGGSLVVTMPFTLPSGVSGDQIVVYYLSDKGELEACSTSYASGKVTFTTSHLSKYVIGTVTTGSDMPFVDVAAGAWYYDAVKWAVDNNITAGVSATSFAPEQSCTRAQMVSFLWRAAGSPKASSGVNPFTDVAAGSWYYDAVLWAVDKGITAGIGDGKFGPEQTVTRGQTVTFLYRYAGEPASANNGTPFVDVPAGEFYTAAVQWAVNNGITAGTTATTFEPLSNCTRAQIVTFLYRDLAK